VLCAVGASHTNIKFQSLNAVLKFALVSDIQVSDVWSQELVLLVLLSIVLSAAVSILLVAVSDISSASRVTAPTLPATLVTASVASSCVQLAA
jgi:hypothetical protein